MKIISVIWVLFFIFFSITNTECFAENKNLDIGKDEKLGLQEAIYSLKVIANTQPVEVSSFIMPEESEHHEGTWLQWPHHYQYGKTYRNNLDATWVTMTKELATSEKVHLIAYNQTEKDRIIALLNAQSVPMTNIDFKIYKTNDVWIRDNGPIYVRDKDGKLVIQDWGFNGWGNKADYEDCNTIPSKIARDQGKTVVNINSIMTNEGGSVEIELQRFLCQLLHC